MSESLYKYQPDNVYTVENILKNQLYLSSPLSFNDPYDMPEIFLTTSEGNQRELLNSELGAIVNRVQEKQGISIKQLAVIKEIYETIKLDRELSDDPAILIDKLLKCMLRVCSFSMNSPTVDSTKDKVNYTIPMFSYYGGSHTGLIIEYDGDIIDECISSNMFIEKVKYLLNGTDEHEQSTDHTFPVQLSFDELVTAKEIIEADELLILSDAQKTLIRRILLNKKKCWAHEDECRVVSLSKERQIMLLTDKSIKGVYLEQICLLKERSSIKIF